MARQLELPEIVTAGKFLILTGIILPLLPNEPVTQLTRVTPYQAWLALVAVCTLSYGSYLLQRYWTSNRSAFVTAILGGLYSSTATTVVLARRASTGEIPSAEMSLLTPFMRQVLAQPNEPRRRQFDWLKAIK